MKEEQKYAMRLILSFIFLIHLQQTQAQSSDPYAECCSLNLMDATRQVAIETDRILTSGTFQAMRVRLCMKDPVIVQIWTRINATEFQFKWQTQLTATDQQLNEIYSIISIKNNPVTIGPNDRLAVYNPSSGSSKISVPYITDRINGTMLYSRSRFTGSQFVSGQPIILEDIKWSRSFSSYVDFCTSESDCAVPTTVTSTPSSTTTTPNNAAPTGTCCAPQRNQQVSCDPNGQIKDNIDGQNDQVTVLETEINRLLILLQNLMNSTVITGICPSGFISGVYGVGSCYIISRDDRIQLGQAALQCRDRYSAELVKIETDLENEFLKNTILQKTNSLGMEYYWMSGIYNIDMKNWYWYNDATRIKAPFSYRNWLNGMEPAAESTYDICSVFTVNGTASYWQKNVCTTNNYYICEIKKQCL